MLRPEGTAGVARALTEASLAPGVGRDCRMWYIGPMFRRERPQAGRFRQFTQLGVEFANASKGEAPAHTQHDVMVDAEVIELAHSFFNSWRIPHSVRVNTLGTAAQRDVFNAAMLDFLRPRYDKLSEASRLRYDRGSCMRIADSRLAEDRDVLADAPRLGEFMDEEERSRFNDVCGMLRESEVPFCVDESLVRGLDYYTRTAFEIDAEGTPGRALCAGGRYADVYKEVSGVGFAMGLERVELAVEQASGVKVAERKCVVVMGLVDEAAVCSEGYSAVRQAVRQLTTELRMLGLVAVTVMESGRVAKRVTRAIRGGAKVVVVLSERDLNHGKARVKVVSGDNEDESAPVVMKVGKVAKYVEKYVDKLGESEGYMDAKRTT